MRFRDLKRQNFIIYFSGFYGYNRNAGESNNPDYTDADNSFIVYQDGKLTLHAYWEYDNGLYVNSGYEEIKTTWKDLKYNLKNNYNKNSLIWIFNGKCPRCGCKLTSENFNFNPDFGTPFEYDFYYCNKCKQDQVDDFVKFMDESNFNYD